MENSTSPALQASGSDSAGIVLGTTPIGQIGAGLMPPGADAYSGIYNQNLNVHQGPKT